MDKSFEIRDCPGDVWQKRERKPDYNPDYENVWSFFGKYPQLVNTSMMDTLKTFADKYVESISSEGMPQKLANRFTGKIPSVYKIHKNAPEVRKYNTYYPSPEMHVNAAKKLLPTCRAFLTE